MTEPTLVDLTTDLAGLVLPAPVVVASGCGGAGRELAAYTDLAALGAFTTRTITLDPSPGAPGTRLAPTASGVVAATGHPNPGLQGFLATELPWLAQQRTRTVVSITATSLGEYAELGRAVGNAPGVHGVEIHLGGVVDAHQAGKIAHVVRREVPRGVLVLAKLGLGDPVVELTRVLTREGADAVVLGHGPRAMVLDPVTLQPAVGDEARLSGAAVLPLTLRAVLDLHAALPAVPVVACGGVRSGADAAALLAAGAVAVQVGSALLEDPGAAASVAAGLADELASRGLSRPADLVGMADRAFDQTIDPALHEGAQQ